MMTFVPDLTQTQISLDAKKKITNLQYMLKKINVC